jgi:hypothetical protein
MSRGPGKVQLAVQVCLTVHDGEILVLYDIAKWIFGQPALRPVSRAHIESVRRALKDLQQQGAVDLFYVTADSLSALGERSRRRQLAARLKGSGSAPAAP